MLLLFFQSANIITRVHLINVVFDSVFSVCQVSAQTTEASSVSATLTAAVR